MPGNKLHFSLCAAAAATTPLLRDNFTSILHILLKISCLYIQYVWVCLVYLGKQTDRRMRDGDPLNADHILGLLYFHGQKKPQRFRCLVMLDAFPLKGSFDGDGGVQEDG